MVESQADNVNGEKLVQQPQQRSRTVRQTNQSAKPAPCPIVGIGASAGGLEAIRKLLRALPPNLPYAYVVLQHISPTHKSLLPEILARETDLNVVPLTNATLAKPGTIYVVPPNSNAVLQDGLLLLELPDRHSFPKPSINTFFTCLGNELGDSAVGVVLSGTGSDGTLGLKNIMAAGGECIVQDPSTAEHSGIPIAAIEAGVADFVLAPEQVARQLEEIQHIVTPMSERAPNEKFPRELFKIIQDKYNLDFSEYKSGTLWRRLQRRLASTQCANVAEYLEYVHANPVEVDALLRDILITVTSFFRDQSAFNELRPYIRQMCLHADETSEDLRVWVAGCATGEEAYTLSFLIRECLDELAIRVPYQIFATDVELEALRVARAGVYREALVQGFTPEQLTRFFTKMGDDYEVRKEFKDTIVFARHDLVNDPPFIRVDLISCRNVLIYMNSRLQAKILNRFAFSLNAEGLLFLGRSEGLGQDPSSFEVLNSRERIYRCAKSPTETGVPAISTAESATSLRHAISSGSGRAMPSSGRPLTKGNFVLGVIAKSLHATFALCALDGSVLHTAGDVDQFFKFPGGQTKFNISDIIVPELRGEASALLYEHRRKRMVMYGREHVMDKGVFRLIIHPALLESAASGILLVIERVRDVGASDLTTLPLAAYVENELLTTRENLQAVVEELATANEEMQSLNEEAQAANEELQATNEELEASNEELQATNEELLTVNQELNAKSSELTGLNSDFESLYNALDFPVIVFDHNYNLHRYNRACLDLYGNMPWHIGAAFSELRLPEYLRNLRTTMVEAVASNQTVRTVLESDHHRYQLQVAPKFSDNDGVHNVIVSLIDTTELATTRRELLERENFLAELVTNTTVALASKDLSGRYLFANPSFRQLFGLSDRDVAEVTDFDIFPDSFAAELWANDLAAIKALRSISADYSVELTTGHRFLQVKHQIVRDIDNRPKSLLLEFVDITQQKKADYQLKLAAKVYQNAGEGIFVTDAEGHILTVNEAFERITGFNRDQAIGVRLDDLMPLHPDYTENYKQQQRSMRAIGFWQGELSRRRSDGEYFPEWLSTTRIIEDNGDQYVTVMSDISDIKESQRRTEYLSTHDSLTGLANRALFYDRLERSLAANRRANRLTGLLFMDLDKFKEVNDTKGHDVGDDLLLKVAERLTNIVRVEDTVARLGGDEFAVIIDNASEANIDHITSQILAEFRKPFICNSHVIEAPLSIGAAIAPIDGDTVAEIFKAADMALYRAKEAGRDRMEFFSVEMQQELTHRLAIESELRLDLERRNLQLAFQPKVNATSPHRIVGAEVLLRWTNATLGRVTPDVFIPLAETSQLILEIDRYVIDQTMNAIRVLHKFDFVFAINVSARTLTDPGFAEYVQRRLEWHHIKPSRIMFEVTERALVGEGSTALGNMHVLNMLGIKFSIDDFGTGFSSLSYLKRLPISELKIDKSFIDGVGGVDSNDESIASAIIQMARSLGLNTVAEGVETTTQARWLLDKHCAELQGYLFSPALPLQGFKELLTAHTEGIPQQS